MERHLDYVARNVPHYSDPADVLIGVGASAIGRLPQGYVQDAADIGGWGRAVKSGRLPVVRRPMPIGQGAGPDGGRLTP